MAIYQILPLLLLFPLIGALINGTIGKRLPEKIIGSIATLMTAIPFILALVIFFQLDEPIKSVLFTAIDLGTLHLDVSLYADNLSIWMTLIVTGVGTLIHLYSIGYMSGDKGFYKFFTYLNLFIFSMLILVLGSNYFMLYFGWEGVGVCSYLLIGYYYADENEGLMNSKAGRKSFIMNRVGDLGLFIAFALILANFGSLEYDVVGMKMLGGEALPSVFIVSMITLSLFIGATGKSAQIPLFTWLPDAMAGPTPVSALIHAATMVTAGIFLMVRSNFLLEFTPDIKDVILYVGLITSIVAAFIAMRQNDIKKVLAYSTVSQLGLIFVAIGLGAYSVAIFHVTTHAFFKALLFLGAGSVIHAMDGEQSIRKMGGLKDKIKITHITFLLATLAISGFPLFSGFFSKDEILGIAFEKSVGVYIALAISSAMTALYMFRLYFVVFHGSFRDTKDVEHHVHESPLNMTIPLMILAVLSVIGGIFDLPGIFLKGNFTHYLDKLLGANVLGLDHHPAHPEFNTTLVLLAVAIIIVLVVLFLSNTIYRKKGVIPKADEQYTGWEKLSNKNMYWDEAYDLLIVKPIEGLSKTFYAVIDTLIIGGIVQGIAKTVSLSGDVVRKWQSGKVNGYIFWMVCGIIGFITFFLLKI
jgi:NADH-quinone oxidoreductase subunit L